MPDAITAILVYFILIVGADANQDYRVRWAMVGVYEFFIYNGSTLETYEGAKQKCSEMKSHLAIVNSDEIQKILVDLIKQWSPDEVGFPYTSFYIGLHDYGGGNTNFIWENGDILHFITGTPMQWANSEPNDFNNMAEDCVTMGSSSTKADYKWFDVPCFSKRSYICQRLREEAVPISAESHIVSTSVVLIIIGAIVLTAIYHRRRIANVHLVAEPPLAPYNNATREKEIKANKDDQVVNTTESWINGRGQGKKNSVMSV